MKIDRRLRAKKLVPAIQRLFDLSARKILSIQGSWNPSQGTPVFTSRGRYTTRGWTEWTQGFQYGAAILQFDATGEERFLEIGKEGTFRRMAAHVSHIGVHDHGFNNVSTYGNLLRLMHEGRIEDAAGEREFYQLALKVSGAVQAARWTRIADGTGFIHSFNGPHSLFIDTIRSVRVLVLADALGHALMGEHDERISLMDRAIQHLENTARFGVYYGDGRDAYDVPGRTAHESVFNVTDGQYRCPNSQQGYSPFSTWTRGLAWAICGFAEELEFFSRRLKSRLGSQRWRALETVMLKAARATADFYIQNSCRDGIPMWDTGAPGLHQCGPKYLDRASDPYNAHEPVDSSAAAIAAQGLLRLGNYLSGGGGDASAARRYHQAGLTVAATLMEEPYLSTQPRHQGLILHSIYHRPNGWDTIAKGQSIPNGESSMWGDYHALELGLMILREAEEQPPLRFDGCLENG